jgi:putative zinc finger/helix-turn-helix YgiT family protein
MKCYRCKNETQISLVEKYQYKEAGLQNVYLKNIEVRNCDTCDLHSPIIPRILFLHEKIAQELTSKQSLLTGDEIRFLRKQLRLKSQDWATFLRKDVSHISRVENRKTQINKDLDLLIRLSFIYLWEVKNGEKFASTVSTLTNIHQDILIDVSYFEDEIILNKTQFDYPNDFSVTAVYKGEGVKTYTFSPPSS